MNVRLLPRAADDLAEITSYIALDDPRAALRLLKRFRDNFARLARFPELGTARDEVRPGVRLFPVGRYIVLYRIAADDIEIVRVIHGAREWRELL